MNWEEKLLVLQQCGGNFRKLLWMRLPGEWVCALPGLTIGPGGSAPSQQNGIGASPQEAAEHAWMLATGPAVRLLLNTDNGCLNEVVWWCEPARRFEHEPKRTEPLSIATAVSGLAATTFTELGRLEREGSR